MGLKPPKSRKHQPAFAALVRQSGQSGDDRALSRALSELRAHQARTHLGQADHRHRADRLGPVALQPPSPRTGRARARRHPRGRRHRLRISGASDPGNRQAADRRARSQSRLSRPGRNSLRLSARRRRADDRLRQDHAGLLDGGGDGQHSGHRAVGRADAQRLVERRARWLRHGGLAGARRSRRRQDQLRRVHRHRHLVGAVGRPLQHHGHRFDHECAGRSARHVVAGLRGDPGALSRARADRL